MQTCDLQMAMKLIEDEGSVVLRIDRDEVFIRFRFAILHPKRRTVFYQADDVEVQKYIEQKYIEQNLDKIEELT